MAKLKIRTKRPWIGYPGSTLQQNYAEDVSHGYLLWTIDGTNCWDVQYCGLPNPKPYVTIEWLGDVAATVEAARAYPKGARFRVHSHDILSQRDVVDLTSRLRAEVNATEVTFKTDHHIERNVISSGATTLIKEDLRNADVLLRLIKDFHSGVLISDDEWLLIHDLVKLYLAQLHDEEGVVRNTRWSLRHLAFDNLFAYGDGNAVNFENLDGIVGVFGPNRAGKSSVVGTIMYVLFNTTDRGSLKNLHVINVRKPYCYARAIINVNGTDYAIERQTVKHENKRGHVHASTALNVFKIEDGEAIDLAGEERKDTERVIRKLIGSPEDFLLTSLSAQDELKLFISQGSSRRRQILSRFLDLDVFDKMYDQAKNDVNAARVLLKSLPDRDWASVDNGCRQQIDDCSKKIKCCDDALFDAKEKLEQLKRQLAAHHDFTPVTKAQVEQQRARVVTLTNQANVLALNVETLRSEVESGEKKIASIEAVQQEHDLSALKRRLEALKSLEDSLKELKHAQEREVSVLKQQERSLKILDDVPCGDQYPTCKFIKDAHVNRGKIHGQRDRVDRVVEKLAKAEAALSLLKDENIRDKVEKVEQLGDMLMKLKVTIAQKKMELLKLESSLETLVSSSLEPAQARLLELEEALRNDENVEVVSLRAEIDKMLATIKQLDTERLALAVEQGRIQTTIDKNEEERVQRAQALSQMRIYDLVAAAFSRRGLPQIIVSSQLPLINAEVAKILHGIVDFTIELEADDESDTMEVYINYGDSRRIIELCSGMEKMIASVAIRVALINVSSLPKTDMFVIDEGFGALDDAGVEACNRLLQSLKRYFRCVVVITHVDGVKDAVDHTIEISKREKDAYTYWA